MQTWGLMRETGNITSSQKQKQQCQMSWCSISLVSTLPTLLELGLKYELKLSLQDDLENSATVFLHQSLTCFTLEMLVPGLSKQGWCVCLHGGCRLVSSAIGMESGKFLKTKRRAHPLDFQAFAGSRGRRPGVLLQPPSLVSLSVSLSLSFLLLLLPVVSTQAYPLQLTPTCTQTCLNNHHRVRFCLLFYQLLNQVLSTLPEHTWTPSCTVHGGEF